MVEQHAYLSDESDSPVEDIFDGKLLPHIQRKMAKMSTIFITQIESKVSNSL